MKQFYRILVILIVMTGVILAQGTPLSLDDCINIALKNNSTLRMNKAYNEMADESVQSSYNGILPTLNLNATTGRYEAGPTTDLRDVPVGTDPLTGETIIRRIEITQPGFGVNYNDLNLSLNQNLFDGGEWWSRIGYWTSAKKSSDFALRQVTDDVVLQVQERFFDLLKQRKLLEVYNLAVQRSKDQLTKTEKMFDLGAVAKVDVYRSRVNLGNDEIQMLLQKNSVLNAQNNLNIAMGRNPGTPVELKPNLSLTTAYENTESLIEQSIKSNPGLQKSKQDIETDDINVSRSYAILSPKISAYARYSRSNEQLSRVYGDFDKNYSVSYGLSLSLNLFNGFQDKVNIQKSKLTLRNTQETFENDKRLLMSNVIQLRDNYNAYLDIIKINEQNLEAAKEEYRLAEERYRIGSGTALEVREAQVNLTRAEQTLVAAEYNARITQAQLEHKLGSIYRAPNEE